MKKIIVILYLLFFSLLVTEPPINAGDKSPTSSDSLTYYKYFLSLEPQEQLAEARRLYKLNTDLVFLTALLRQLADQSKYEFISDILPGMEISVSYGCAGCFGDGIFGKRDLTLISNPQKKNPKLYLDPVDMPWNIVGMKLYIRQEDKYLPTELSGPINFETNGVNLVIYLDDAIISPDTYSLGPYLYAVEPLFYNLQNKVDIQSSIYRLKKLIKKEHIGEIKKILSLYSDEKTLDSLYDVMLSSSDLAVINQVYHQYWISKRILEKSAIIDAFSNVISTYSSSNNQAEIIRKNIDLDKMWHNYLFLPQAAKSSWKKAFTHYYHSSNYIDSFVFLESRDDYQRDMVQGLITAYGYLEEIPDLIKIINDKKSIHQSDAAERLGLIGSEKEKIALQNALIQLDKYDSYTKKNYEKAIAQIEYRTEIQKTGKGVDVIEYHSPLWIIDPADIYSYNFFRMFDSNQETFLLMPQEYQPSLWLEFAAFVEADCIAFVIPDNPRYAQSIDVKIKGLPEKIEISVSDFTAGVFENVKIEIIIKVVKDVVYLYFPKKYVFSTLWLTFLFNDEQPQNAVAISEMRFFLNSKEVKINFENLPDYKASQEHKSIDLNKEIIGTWSVTDALTPEASLFGPEDETSFFPNGKCLKKRSEIELTWSLQNNLFKFGNETAYYFFMDRIRDTKPGFYTQIQRYMRLSPEPKEIPLYKKYY